MKRNIAQSVRRAVLLLAALMLVPVGAQARERADTTREHQGGETPERGVGGRAGIVEEFNFGPTGTDVILQREDGRNEGGLRQQRVLSGKVIELKGKTLYVEREGVVVPLDTSALRITQQPRVGQEIIASYEVRETNNVALSLAGEVDPARQ
jgi:hypothetical protein